jgi:hypothetical protein
VHSARAKRLPPVRWAERRGITTIAPLLQATLPGFGDVAIDVRIGAPLPPPAPASARATREDVFVNYTNAIRAAVARLGTSRAKGEDPSS